MSDLPDLFQRLCFAQSLPFACAEYLWHPTRKFRADYGFPGARILIEVEGGVWTRGKHGRGSGIITDMEKQNEASAHGWRVIRVLPDPKKPRKAGKVPYLTTLDTIKLLKRAMTL